MKVSKMLIPFIISILFAGCGNSDVSTSTEKDVYDVETESTTEEVTEEYVPVKSILDDMTEYESWQAAYKELLINHISWEENIHATRFSLLDFDGDDVPELCLGLIPALYYNIGLYQIYQAEKGDDEKYRVSNLKTYLFTDNVNYPLYYLPGKRIFSYGFGVSAKGTYTMAAELFDENGEIYKRYKVGELCDSEYKIEFDDSVLETLGIHFDAVYSVAEYSDEWVEIGISNSYEINEENISRYIEGGEQ